MLSQVGAAAQLRICRAASVVEQVIMCDGTGNGILPDPGRHHFHRHGDLHASGSARLRAALAQSLEHFPPKWTPVRRRKCDQSKDLEHVSNQLDRNML
jgi:hypothetical protein